MTLRGKKPSDITLKLRDWVVSNPEASLKDALNAGLGEFKNADYYAARAWARSKDYLPPTPDDTVVLMNEVKKLVDHLGGIEQTRNVLTMLAACNVKINSVVNILNNIELLSEEVA